MGIKAHYLTDKDGNKFYPYAHADAVYNREGKRVGDILDDIEASITNVNTNLNNKVEKIDGMGLSSNDYTDDEKTKLDGIEEGAEVNVQADWNETDTTSDAYIKNKPTSFPTDGGNADTVNNHTVEADVPSDAKFTDTVYTHPDSGVTAGTYKSVTVDEQGHVTSGTNPTTLAEYGITDAVSDTELETALDKKVDSVKIGETEYKSGTTVTLPVYTTDEADTTFGADIGLTIDTSTYKMTLVLKDNKGQTLSSKEIDFPIESMVINASYASGILTLALQNGNTLDVDISAIISGLVPDTRIIAGVDLKDNITAAELRTALNVADGANNYTHPTSGVTAGTYRSVTVNANGHVTAGSNPTTTIAQGGTGATTVKGAEYNILSEMEEVTSDRSDTSYLAGVYTSPSTTQGKLFYFKFSLLWTYIKSKISSVLGLSETGLASGKSIGGVTTRSVTIANTNGYPSYLLMFDITTWYNSTTTNQSKLGFTGEVISQRQGGYLAEHVTKIYMSVAYQKATAENGTTLCLRTDSTIYRPCIVYDSTNEKYYLALRVGGSNRTLYLQGVFVGTYVGTKIQTTDSDGTMPEGYEVVQNDYKIIVSPRATADANGNVITDTYATQTEVDKKYDSSVSRTANTVLAAPNGSAGSASFRSLVANDLPVVPSSKGGTGQTSLVNSANTLINSLTTGSSDPNDADYYIAQYANGGTTTTTYHRKPFSTLWNYIKSKISSVLGLTATNYNGTAATATRTTVNDGSSDVERNIVVANTTTTTGQNMYTVPGVTANYAKGTLTATGAVTGGTLKVGDDVTLEYNSTTNSLDFNFL